LRDRDWAIASSLYTFTSAGWRDNNWRAWNFDLAPARTNTALMEAVLTPFPFANSAKGEPCIAYRIPIRQGCCWARPAGKLAVTLTLGDDVKPEDVVFARPTEVKRDGRTLTYTLDGADPDEDLSSPDRVKVVRAANGDALYFSRANIPYPAAGHGEALAPRLLHIGLYGFRLAALRRFTALAPSPLEKTEKLEQLRLLENGVPLRVVLTEARSHGVDRAEDLAVISRLVLETNLCKQP
jgi:hypothetical protein